MQGPVSNPEQPDVNRVRALRPQTLRCRPEVAGDCPTPAVNVDGDICPVVVCLDLRTDVPLIYLVAQASSLFARSACRHDSFPTRDGRRSLCVLHAFPFMACYSTWRNLPLTGVCDKERRSVQGSTATVFGNVLQGRSDSGGTTISGAESRAVQLCQTTWEET